jgi:tetratricopeptide (TPR) repeat protein
MHTDACEATHRRGEQSDELLDLRMECLGRRLEETRALVELFAHADAQVVARAAQAAQGLSPLEGCANVAALRAPTPPAASVRAAVDDVRRRLDRARALEAAGKYPEALAIAGAMVPMTVALGYRPLEAEAQAQAGWLHNTNGDATASERLLKRAIVAAEAGRDDRLGFRAWVDLLWVIGAEQQRATEVEEVARHASAYLERGADDTLAPRLERTLGAVAFWRGDYQTALAHFQRAQAQDEQRFGAESGDAILALRNVAQTLQMLGRTEDSLALTRRTLALQEKVLGRVHPDLANTVETLGELLAQLGHIDQALPEFQRTLALREEAYGPMHPLVARALTAIAKSDVDLGRPEDALAPAERALSIYAHRAGYWPGETVYVAEADLVLARALWASGGDRRRADELARKAAAGIDASAEGRKLAAELEAWQRAR